MLLLYCIALFINNVFVHIMEIDENGQITNNLTMTMNVKLTYDWLPKIISICVHYIN